MRESEHPQYHHTGPHHRIRAREQYGIRKAPPFFSLLGRLLLLTGPLRILRSLNWNQCEARL
jgi:hypothetical protein